MLYEVITRSFILPEHKRAMERQDHESKRKTKPILDTQELEQIQQALSESFHMHKRISLRLYDEFEDVEISGIVIAVQSYRQEIVITSYSIHYTKLYDDCQLEILQAVDQHIGDAMALLEKSTQSVEDNIDESAK